ncbi:histidinol-phosphate transaminase [Aureliella helgolandensis]|nr:histidinol-phosphate transaminase [Aureliella helgolandensis]
MTHPASDIESLFRPEIQQLSPYVPGEQPQGGKFIKLNTNENPYPPSQKVITAIQEAAAARLERYPDPLGNAFRTRAAEVLGVEPDWILCGNGSDDILTILTRSFVGQGQKLRLPYPSYILYRTLAQLQGASSEEVPFQPDFTLDARFAEMSDELRLIFLPNPNSPSGTMLPPAKIAAVAERLTCPLLIDEAYADFADTNCIELVRQNPRLMVSRTLSKSYGLAGLRFGFLIAQPEIISMLRKVKDSYNCDSLSLAGATAAIDDQKWLASNLQKVIATRGRMTLRLRELGFEVADSQANFVWCTRRDRPVQPLYEALKKDKVLVRYMNYAGWGDGLRISVGTDDQIDACLALLASYL